MPVVSLSLGQSWTVPSGVSSVTLYVYGVSGKPGSGTGAGAGGSGHKVQLTYPVSAGQVIDCQRSFGGGATSSSAGTRTGGIGGDGGICRIGGTAIIWAAGGGGGGGAGSSASQPGGAGGNAPGNAGGQGGGGGGGMGGGAPSGATPGSGGATGGGGGNGGNGGTGAGTTTTNTGGGGGGGGGYGGGGGGGYGSSLTGGGGGAAGSTNWSGGSGVVLSASSATAVLVQIEYADPNQPPHTPGTPSATSVGTTTATLNASVSDPEGNNVYAHFQWSTSSTFASGVSSGNGSTVASGGTSSLNIGSLASSTTYYVRAYAVDSHGAGSGWSATGSFVTATPNSPPNTPSSLSASSVGATSANIHAVVSDPNGGNVTGHFQFGTDPNWGSGNTGAGTTVGSGSTSTRSISGLASGTVYYFRAYASDPQGATSGWSGNASFTTTVPNNPPNVPTNLGPTGARGVNAVTLTATVSDPDGNNCYAQWQVSTDSTFASGVTTVNGSTVASGSNSTAAFTGTANTTYYLRARTVDSAGAVSGYTSTVSFITNRYPTITANAAPANLSRVKRNSTQQWVWSFSDPDGQAQDSWSLSFYDPDSFGTIYYWNGSGLTTTETWLSGTTSAVTIPMSLLRVSRNTWLTRLRARDPGALASNLIDREFYVVPGGLATIV